MNNMIYKKMLMEDFDSADKYTLIYAPNKDKRSFASIYKLKEKIIFEPKKYKKLFVFVNFLSVYPFHFRFHKE